MTLNEHRPTHGGIVAFGFEFMKFLEASSGKSNEEVKWQLHRLSLRIYYLSDASVGNEERGCQTNKASLL